MKVLAILLLIIVGWLAVISGRNVYVERDATLFTANQVTSSTWFPYVALLVVIGILCRYISNQQWMEYTLKFWPLIQVLLICAGFFKLGFVFLFLFAPLNFTGEVIAASYLLTSLIIDRENTWRKNCVLFVINAIIAIFLIVGITTDYRANLPM